MKIASISLYILLAFGSVYAQWSPLSSGVPVNLKQIYFTDTMNGYCVGGGDIYGWPATGQTGTIIRTQNGGATWETVFQDSLFGFSRVVALGDTVMAFGIKNGGQSYIVKSTDNGISWNEILLPFGLADNIRKTVFLVNGKLYCLSFDLKIYFSNNYGDNWSIINSPVVSVFEIVDNAIYGASGPPHKFYKSSNGGVSWDSSSINPPNPLSPSPWMGSSLWVFGDTTVLYTTYPYVTAHSYDDGLSWESDTFTSRIGLYHFSTNEFIGYYEGNIYKTYDGGLTYTYIQQLGLANDIFFLNPNTGFLCGENGMFIKQ